MIDLELRRDPEFSPNIGEFPKSCDANVTEDTIFFEDGVPVGFYLTRLRSEVLPILNKMNSEFMSSRVPKTKMARGTLRQAIQRKQPRRVRQYSTIIGAIPAKPHFKRYTSRVSAVHRETKAREFCRQGMMLAKATEIEYSKYLPELFSAQKSGVTETVPNRLRLTDLFTSSISNANISAPFHQDNGNIRGSVNAIYTRKNRCEGGFLTIPEYRVVVETSNNSLLMYPAWRNVHGVTPIISTGYGGYRNSFVFYSLGRLMQGISP